jgi:hypothetical protein
MNKDISFDDEKNLFKYKYIYFVFYSHTNKAYFLIQVEHRAAKIKIYDPFQTRDGLLNYAMTYIITNQIIRVQEKNHEETSEFISRVYTVPKTNNYNSGVYLYIMAFHKLNVIQEYEKSNYLNYFRSKILFAF